MLIYIHLYFDFLGLGYYSTLKLCKFWFKVLWLWKNFKVLCGKFSSGHCKTLIKYWFPLFLVHESLMSLRKLLSQWTYRHGLFVKPYKELVFVLHQILNVFVSDNGELKIWRRARLRRGRKWVGRKLHMRGDRRCNSIPGRRIMLQRRVVDGRVVKSYAP